MKKQNAFCGFFATRPAFLSATAGAILVSFALLFFSGKESLWAISSPCQSNPNRPECSGGQKPSGGTPAPSSSNPDCNIPEVQAILNGQDPFGGAPSGSCGSMTTQLTAQLSLYRKAQGCIADKKAALQATLTQINNDIALLKQDPNFVQLTNLQTQKATCQLSLQDKCCQKKNAATTSSGDNGASCSTALANCNTNGGTWISPSDERVKPWLQAGGGSCGACGGICYRQDTSCFMVYGNPTLKDLAPCFACDGNLPKPQCHGKACLGDIGDNSSNTNRVTWCGRIDFSGEGDEAVCGKKGGSPCILGADGKCGTPTPPAPPKPPPARTGDCTHGGGPGLPDGMLMPTKICDDSGDDSSSGSGSSGGGGPGLPNGLLTPVKGGGPGLPDGVLMPTTKSAD